MASVDSVLSIFISQIGTTEDPRGSNHTKYGAWYGIDPAPWCAMFVSWCFDQAGATLDMHDQINDSTKGFASVGFGKAWFDKHGLLVNDPQRGDLVFFEWENDQWPDHVGIVESVNADGSVNTIEGNSPGQDHTDEVARHFRTRKVARWFGRPTYDNAPIPAPVPPVPAPVPPQTFSLTQWGPQNHPQLSINTSGPNVVHMQALLGGLKVDGQFGPHTLQRLKDVQAAHGLTIDGVCGIETWSTLHDTLRQGMVSPAVGEAQRCINVLAVDNDFGPQTLSGVLYIQQTHALTADGIVGQQTWRVLLSG